MPGIDWKKIAGMRDWISHVYYRVDPEIVWNVVDKEVPALLRTLQAFKDENQPWSGKPSWGLTGIGKDNRPRLGPSYFKWVSNQRNKRR